MGKYQAIAESRRRLRWLRSAAEVDTDVFILSLRAALPVVGWTAVYEFEDRLAEATGGTIHTAAFRGPSARRVLRGPLRRRFGHFTVPDPPRPTPGRRSLLLAVATTPAQLQMLLGVPAWRSFDQVAAYVIDSYRYADFPPLASQLDHIFTPILEDVEVVQRRTGVPTTLIPFAYDVLVQGSDRDHRHRPIDVIGYGRQPPEHQRAIRDAFNRPGTGRIYFHSTYEQPRPRNFQQERDLFWKILRRSNLALAFCTKEFYQRPIPVSIVTCRWFECMTAGCVVVGRRPTTPLADQLFDWTDATIEAPDDPAEFVPFIEDLLAQPERLDEARRITRRHCLARHDLRHRIRDMWSALDLRLPERLEAELEELARVSAASRA